MAGTAARGEPVEASIEAVVIRADGSRQELGRVAYWHRSWLKRRLWNLRQLRSRTSQRHATRRS